MRIGIPRALYYYYHPGLWETFVRELGHEPVVSAPTGPATIAAFADVTEAEHCLPNKIFDGHVVQLRGRIDALLVPRILSLTPGHIACPKFGALPDAVAAADSGHAPVIRVDIDVTNRPLRATLVALGRSLGASVLRARRAARAALEAWRVEQERLDAASRTGDPPRILLLGHPYTLYDHFVGRPVRRKLASMDIGCEIVSFAPKKLVPGDILWCTFRKMWDRLLRLSPDETSGVIQISTFNCGADAMMIERFSRLCADKRVPYMVLKVDEHFGAAGFDTRIEAFWDSICWRARKEAP